MVIWSDFRVGQYIDDDHWEYAPYFIYFQGKHHYKNMIVTNNSI